MLEEPKSRDARDPKIQKQEQLPNTRIVNIIAHVG